jgi:SAM-dependent methyltransferase
MEHGQRRTLNMEREEHHIRYWDEAAAAYSSYPQPERVVYEPAVDELLGDVAGKLVLDAGCGDGRYSRKLNSLGAIVTGIDGSVEMISIAKGYPAQTDLGFEVADLTKRLPFPDGCYDIVLANMVLMDIPRIDVASTEFARLLVDHGLLVFSITHPSFFCYNWDTDEKGEKLYKKIPDYLTPRIVELNFWGKILHFHRPISHYFDVLSQSGFCVEHFKEPMPSEDFVKKHPSWEHDRRLPEFAVIRAIQRCRVASNADAGDA